MAAISNPSVYLPTFSIEPNLSSLIPFPSSNENTVYDPLTGLEFNPSVFSNVTPLEPGPTVSVPFQPHLSYRFNPSAATVRPISLLQGAANAAGVTLHSSIPLLLGFERNTNHSINVADVLNLSKGPTANSLLVAMGNGKGGLKSQVKLGDFLQGVAPGNTTMRTLAYRLLPKGSKISKAIISKLPRNKKVDVSLFAKEISSDLNSLIDLKSTLKTLDIDIPGGLLTTEVKTDTRFSTLASTTASDLASGIEAAGKFKFYKGFRTRFTEGADADKKISVSGILQFSKGPTKSSLLGAMSDGNGKLKKTATLAQLLQGIAPGRVSLDTLLAGISPDYNAALTSVRQKMSLGLSKRKIDISLLAKQFIPDLQSEINVEDAINSFGLDISNELRVSLGLSENVSTVGSLEEPSMSTSDILNAATEVGSFQFSKSIQSFLGLSENKIKRVGIFDLLKFAEPITLDQLATSVGSNDGEISETARLKDLVAGVLQNTTVTLNQLLGGISSDNLTEDISNELGERTVKLSDLTNSIITNPTQLVKTKSFINSIQTVRGKQRLLVDMGESGLLTALVNHSGRVASNHQQYSITTNGVIHSTNGVPPTRILNSGATYTYADETEGIRVRTGEGHHNYSAIGTEKGDFFDLRPGTGNRYINVSGGIGDVVVAGDDGNTTVVVGSGNVNQIGNGAIAENGQILDAATANEYFRRGSTAFPEYGDLFVLNTVTLNYAPTGVDELTGFVDKIVVANDDRYPSIGGVSIGKQRFNRGSIFIANNLEPRDILSLEEGVKFEAFTFFDYSAPGFVSTLITEVGVDGLTVDIPISSGSISVSTPLPEQRNDLGILRGIDLISNPNAIQIELRQPGSLF